MKKIVYRREDTSSPVQIVGVGVFIPNEPVEVSDNVADFLLRGKWIPIPKDEQKEGGPAEELVQRPPEGFEEVV